MRLRRSARKPAKHKARLRRARTPSTSTANATASATDPATARVPGYSAALVSQGLRPATGREQATERRIRAKSHRPGALRGPQAVYNATLDVQGHTTGYRPREGHVSVIDQLRHQIRHHCPHGSRPAAPRRVPRPGMPSTSVATSVVVSAAHAVFLAALWPCLSCLRAGLCPETVCELRIPCPSSTLLKLIVIRPPENANLLVRAFLHP